MKPITPAPGVDRDRAATGAAAGNADAKTPNTDMQAEDAGSSDSSGADALESADDSATAATRAMKQTSKTAAESSGKR